MTPAVAALLSCPARPVPGAALLARLYLGSEPGVNELLELQPDIEMALNQANRLAYQSEQVVKRCLALKPVSTPKPPTGF